MSDIAIKVENLSKRYLTAQRDWGDARDYVRGMWLILQHEKPEDFVFATGVRHSVQDIVGEAFHAVGLDAKNTSGKMSVPCALPNPTGWWEIRPRRGSFSNGDRKPLSRL